MSINFQNILKITFAKRFLLITYLQVYVFDSVTKPENMEEMVKLITVEPTDSDDEKLRYK